MRPRHLLAIAVVTSALVPSNAAANDPLPASTVVQEIEQALSAEGLSGPTISNGIEMPSDGNGEVAITPGGSEDGGVVLAAPKLTLGVPANGNGTTVGATTVFDGDAAANQIAVQATDSGARALIRLNDASARTTYRFSLGGTAAALQAQADGSVLVLAESGATLATLATAWARDAGGRDIATHYELDGTDVVQVIDHRHADVAYPVVADPSVDLDPGWFSITATFSRDITNSIASFTAGSVGASAAIAESCSLIPHLLLKVACKGVIAGRAYNFINSAREARSQRKCLSYQAHYVSLKGGWFGVNGDENCKDR